MLSLLPLPSWCWTSSDQFLNVYFIQLFYFLWECWFRTSFSIMATHLWFKIFCRWNKVWFLIVGKEIIWSHELSPKKNFIFIKNFIEQHSHCFVPLSSAIFRQLQDSVFPKLVIFFEQRTVPGTFTVFQGIDIFFIKIIYKDGNLKMHCLVNMVCESKLPSQAVTVVDWSARKHAVLTLFLCVFCWLILDVFHQVLLKHGLIGCSYLLEWIVWFSRSST